MGTVAVRHELGSAALVRARLSADLAVIPLEADSVDDVVLVASELVGNALEHTTSQQDDRLNVSWYVDVALPLSGDGAAHDTVTVVVADHSPELPWPRLATRTCGRGRGMQIVEALSEAWGVDPSEDGKCVWARVPVVRAAA